MTASRIFVFALALAACETPPLTLRYALTDGDSQKCTSESTGNDAMSCSDLKLDCRAYLSIRIVPPATPEIPYVSVCQLLSTGAKDLCAIASVDLPQPASPIPEQVLEVQMAVFEKDTLELFGERDTNGSPICPRVQFGIDGLPINQVDCSQVDSSGACKLRPAFGGRAFYHPGDSETLVKLGCTEPELLKAATCHDEDRTEVIATVNEFEYPQSVDPATANQLFVSIGEPKPGASNNYTLDAANTHVLTRVANAALPSWTATFDDLGVTSSFCIEVVDASPLAPRTLTCRLPPNDPSKIDATGIRLKSETLTTVLRALYGPSAMFPTNGLVVGIVLDQNFNPVSNAVVNASCASGCTANPPTCCIKYLTADKLSFVFGSGAKTSSTGIWVSDDTPYGTTFSRAGVLDPFPVFGGIVDNKVTAVVLEDVSVGGGQ